SSARHACTAWRRSRTTSSSPTSPSTCWGCPARSDRRLLRVAVTRLGHVVQEDRPEDVPAWFRGEGRQARSFDDTYAGTPPWEIGRPQPALQVRADAGEVRGRVLDSGCGTGEHALMAAAIGLKATGIDSSPRAIALAEDKARERGLSARFLVHDVLHLGSLGEQFDTI